MRSSVFVPVVFITDDNYVVPTAVAITSMIKHKRASTNYQIFIISTCLSSANVDCFKQLETDGVKIEVVQTDVSDLEQLHEFEKNGICQASVSALLKFKLPILLKDYDKIIYLDGDILVKGDIADLYDIDLGDNYVAAVHDTGKLYVQKEIYDQIPGYFNSGVMLLNLQKCRQNNITELLIETKRNSTDQSLMDQNVLNIVFQDRVKHLDVKYNFLVCNLQRSKHMYSLEQLNTLFDTKYTSLKKIEQNALVLHFSSKDKPWKYVDGPYSKEWFKYFLMSPYKHIDLGRSKFCGFNAAKDNKTAVVIELNPCHGECLPGYINYLLGTGVQKIDVLINDQLHSDLPLESVFPSNKNISTNYLKFEEIVAFLNDKKKLAEYGICLFNSNFIYRTNSGVMELFDSSNISTKFLAVEHRQENISVRDLHDANIVVLKQLVDKPVYEVNPHFFGAVKQHRKNTQVKFVTAGNIQASRKNHSILIDAVKYLVEQGETNFKIVVIGKGELSNIPEDLQSYFEFTGRLTYPDMYDRVMDSDFFLTLLDPSNEEHDRYITTGTSGSFQLIYGLNIPCVIAEKFANVHGFTSTNSLIHEANSDFATTLLRAIRMSTKEYNEMKAELEQLAKGIYARSLSELRKAINMPYYRKRARLLDYILWPFYLYKISEYKRHLRLCKSNFYISLGENCFVRTVLARHGLKPVKIHGEKSYPFDLCVSKIRGINKILSNDFNGYFEGLQWDETNLQWQNLELSLMYNHDKDCGVNDKQKLIDRIHGRIKNFQKLKESTKLIFVFSTVDRNTSYKDINALFKILQEYFQGVSFKMVVANCSKTELKDVKRISRKIYYKHIPHPYPNYWGEWYVEEFYNSPQGKKFEKRFCDFVKHVADI